MKEAGRAEVTAGFKRRLRFERNSCPRRLAPVVGLLAADLKTPISRIETSCLSEYESDLEDLYESFDFEDSASRSLSSAQAQETCDNEVPQQETVGHLFSTSGEALYAGSPISTLQSYLLIFQYAVRHSLTAKAFTELLQLLSVHLPRGARLPKTVHSLKRFFVDAFPEAQAVQHFYCSWPLPSPGASCVGSGCSGG